ncbi:MAG TPA: hypothetical protein VFM02_01710 [Candidatus Paceibacterota bacterium]|nr:hypothetical protein [Candidatus Paceibacterota bacterium]
MDNITDLINKINHVIVNPLIVLLFALAVVVFFIGIVQFLFNDTPENRQNASRHMLWGVIGMVIMLSVFAIMNFIVDTIVTLFT